MKKLAILSLSMMLAAGAQAQNAQFDYFKYAGNDARFNVPIDKREEGPRRDPSPQLARLYIR